MNSDIIRLYKSVHTWTGIVAGLALFIAFYAGALTVFKEPLARWASPPDMSNVEAVSLTDAPNLITQTLANHPEAARDLRLNLQASEHIGGRVSWEIHDEQADEHNNLATRHYIATLQADGVATAEEIHPSQLAEFLDVLHRVVGLPFDTEANRWIMGVIAVLYALALVSGVIVLLPTLVKDFFALRLGKNLKRMWLDAHNVVGIISLPFHIVMALTAVVFAYHDGIYALQDKMIHDGKLRESFAFAQPKPAPDQPTDPSLMLPPEELVARAQALSPTFEPYMLQYVAVNTPRATVRVWGRDDSNVVSRTLGGFAPINPYTGEVLTLEYLPGQQSAAATAVSSFFSLHFATFGGTPVSWMYFLLGLAGAWLFYSGNLLWVESRRKKQGKEAIASGQRKDTAIMAAATVGVCLGCICGISLTIASGKWLYGHVSNLTNWHQYVYYAVFFSSLGWAFLRGAAKASADLLWLAAAVTFFIPVTSLLAWLFPSLGMWTHTSIDLLAIDITAFAGGLCLVWMARATTQRVYSGMPTDSLWSAARYKATA